MQMFLFRQIIISKRNTLVGINYSQSVYPHENNNLQEGAMREMSSLNEDLCCSPVLLRNHSNLFIHRSETEILFNLIISSVSIYYLHLMKTLGFNLEL